MADLWKLDVDLIESMERTSWTHQLNNKLQHIWILVLAAIGIGDHIQNSQSHRRTFSLQHID